MAKSKVLIISRTEEAGDEMKVRISKLAREMKGGLSFTTIDPRQLRAEFDPTASVVIFNFAFWEPIDSSLIIQMRVLGYQGPVLVLASMRPEEALLSSFDLERLTILEKPYEEQELLGLVRRMLCLKTTPQRLHRRYETREAANFEFGKRTGLTCLVANLSRGGAYLKFEQPLNAKIGETLVFRVRLSESRNEYVFHARVAWLNERQSSGGVEFVRPNAAPQAA